MVSTLHVGFTADDENLVLARVFEREHQASIKNVEAAARVAAKKVKKPCACLLLRA